MSESIIAIIAAVVAALISGGTMGMAVIGIAKKTVNSIVEQNGKLTDAIERNTHATVQLVQMIEKDRAVDEVKQESQKEHLESVREAALEAFAESRKIHEKLKGRL